MLRGTGWRTAATRIMTRDERVTHLYSPLGANLRPVAQCVAGDICALAKLGSAETGDTISSREQPCCCPRGRYLRR